MTDQNAVAVHYGIEDLKGRVSQAMEKAGLGKGIVNWQDLATLVRIPALEDIRCPASPDKPCTLNGNNLFLIDSVASDSQFKDGVSVPIGYASHSFSVPRPSGTLLYLKLRDDPATVDTVSLPVLPGQ